MVRKPSGKQNTEKKKTDPANEDRSLRKQERDKRLRGR
jgi:hypothetical protein